MKINLSTDKLPVVGSIATMPTRIHTFVKMLPGILAQVDILYIYLDGYKKIPVELINHHKCRPFLPTDDDNLHTCNRFLAPVHFSSDAIIVFFDDDIFYPPDYVSRIKFALSTYGHRSIVGFHGVIFRPPHTSYRKDQISLHFANALPEDTVVHLLGSGTAAFCSGVFQPDPRHWKHHNMADLYLAAEALKSNLSLISLKRDKKWLIPLEENQDDSLWRSVKKDDRTQTSFMCDLLLQYSNTQWQSWWINPSNVTSAIENVKDKVDKKHLTHQEVNHTISSKNTLKVHIDDSRSHSKSDTQYDAFTVGDRKRFATCSGVAWLSDTTFVTVNLYGQHLRVYKISDQSPDSSVALLYEATKGITFPEIVKVSPNKKLMAISHTMSANKGISVHSIECLHGFEIKYSKDIRTGTYHSLCFSPDSRFLAASEIGKIGFVEIIDVLTGKTTYQQTSRLSPLRPKSVLITPNGDYIVIISGAVVKQENTEKSSTSFISLHKFDQQEGTFEDLPVAELEYANEKYVSIEDCCIVSPNGEGSYFNLICVDQANDQVLNFLCNTDTSEIQFVGTVSDDVFFPHGIDVSPSGKSLAVANYGDNSIRILYI
jgi:hypothetical protein